MTWLSGRAEGRRTAVTLAAERRLAAVAGQWRPTPPEAFEDAGPIQASTQAGPVDTAPWTRSALRGLALLLAVALALASYWAWSGRPRAVAMAGDAVALEDLVPRVMATASPFPSDVPSASEPTVSTDGGRSSVAPEDDLARGGAGPGPAPFVAPELVVHVTGLVAHPGLVRLPTGSRVADAVTAAGGVTRRRAADSVNLARLVVDGEQIVVGGGPGAQVPAQPATSASAGTPLGPLDLNAATQADLEDLPGIGPVIAGRIVQWRVDNGAFRSVEELGEVSGIGDAILSQLRPLVRI